MSKKIKKKLMPKQTVAATMEGKRKRVRPHKRWTDDFK